MSRILACFGMVLLIVLPAISQASPIGRITKIVVTQTGLGEKDEPCASFSLTNRQVRAFFDKAVVISASQEHDFFDTGPCFIRGTVETRYDTWEFLIRNMGTGTVTASSGEVFLLADPEQESSLGDG